MVDVKPIEATDGSNTTGNTKDTLLYDYGDNCEVFNRENITLYDGTAHVTKIVDGKAPNCNVESIRDHLNHNVNVNCESEGVFPCNRKIWLSGNKYFEGCGKTSCKEHTYFDMNSQYN